ncbi:MAG: molecular chaperone HtpG [Alphaproteobacteria bacterium]|nr:molecular chaperone HtpG [Alphaproteobacteria bacterium]
MSADTSTEKRSFQAEVSKLLHIVANSLYSEKEVFLRELISNAADACDKLRYEALRQPDLLAGQPDMKITLEADSKAGALTIADSGIGMDRQELIDNLGTIARSGTGAFVDQLSRSDDAAAVSLIGQFGVGFYSAFMVADRVDVVSRRAGRTDAWRWTSDGRGEFSIETAQREQRGTTVTLHLRKDARQFLEPETIRRIVKTHSDHIGVPIALKEAKSENTINAASALWTRPKKDVTPEQYRDFYHHVAQAFDDPWLTIHARAEGKIEYTQLLFVPSSKPFDLFDPERRGHVRLYVRRVFVSEEITGLVPPYLRFLRGIVDSEDLDLNVSREMLQESPLLAKIRKDLCKRVFRELEKKATDDSEGYAKFWLNFGAVLKEGLYEDADVRETLLKLARFRSTSSGDGWISLEDYVGRMRPNQKAIYYISGESQDALKRSPQTEGFKAKEVEVLYLSDPVDDFWINAVRDFKEHPFKSVTRGSSDLKDLAGPEGKEAPAENPVADGKLNSLVALLKLSLDKTVQDVRVTDRLTDSPLCLVAAEGALDMHLERILKQHRRVDSSLPRVLELNPHHELIKAFAELAGRSGASDNLSEAAKLLYDYACILEGESPTDIAAFSRRLAQTMARALNATATA